MKRVISPADIEAYGYDKFYADMFEYWSAAPAVPKIPIELLRIQPDVTWHELVSNFAGNQFTRYILRRVWDKVKDLR